MKKYLSLLAVSAAFITGLFAYNPPVGAEDMCLLSSPAGLSGNLFTAGSISNSSGAESIVVNPALTAENQRVNLNAGYTFLFDSNNQNESQIGSAFQTAILIPNKLFVFSGYLNGIFIPFNDEMYLGNSINVKAGLSKEITDKLNIGISINGGFAWKYGMDWSLGFNCGFVYDIGQLGFLKDFRYGVSVLNLGKNYETCNNNLNNNKSFGIDNEHSVSPFPSIATIKIGAAASLFKNDLMDLGAALDFTIPAFQNFIVDMNLQFTLKQMLTLSIGEKINVRELVNNHNNLIPSVGLFFKFSFDVKNNEYLASRDWSESEMRVSAAYKNMYEKINAISAGVDIDLGMKDTTPPQILIMIDEE